MEGKSIFSLIKGQPRSVVDEIYNSKGKSLGSAHQAAWACKAVFQSLPMMAKCYVMKALFVSESFSRDDIAQWAAPNARKKHEDSLEELVNLRIFVDPEGSGGHTKTDGHTESKPLVEGSARHRKDNGYLRMSPTFQQSFIASLTNPTEPWCELTSCSGGDSFSNNSAEIPPDRLDVLSTRKWDSMLSYLVNLQPTKGAPPCFMKTFVHDMGLMVPGIEPSGKKGFVISSKGYGYMLNNYTAQVWEVVLTTIASSQSQEQALSLLFMLAYCKLGRGYPLEALSETQQLIIADFAQFGIVDIPGCEGRSPAGMFFPCRVAIDMIFGGKDSTSTAGANSNQQQQHYRDIGGSSSCGDSSISISNNGTASMQQRQLSLIVETNLQVVAYMRSDIHLALLQLFVDVHVRMPNVAIGRITRDKAKQAFRSGITAAQIVEFILLHAHPCVAERWPIIPENVTDQLVLWESENHRMQRQHAVVVDFKQVPNINAAQFAEILSNLKHVDVLLWESTEQRLVAIAPEGLQMLQSYLGQNFPQLSNSYS